jgi:hypothetical protein
MKIRNRLIAIGAAKALTGGVAILRIHRVIAGKHASAIHAFHARMMHGRLSFPVP